MVALAVIGIVVGFLVMDLVIRRMPTLARAASPIPVSDTGLRHNGSLSGFRIPRGYSFHPGHTWAKLDQAISGEAAVQPVRIGADDFSVNILGRIDGIQFPQKGATVTAGAPLFSLKQGDKKIDFPAPIGGTIADVNEDLASHPERVVEDSFRSGWIASLHPKNEAELASLERDETAAQRLRRDVRKFREFLMELAGRDSELGTTLADGGAPRRGVLEEFGQEDWERFQREFLGLSSTGRAER